MMTQSTAGGTITSEWMIPELLKTHPETRPVLDRYGLRGCGGPFGPAESLAYFAHAHGVDVDALMGELRKAVEEPSTLESAAESSDKLDDLADAIYRRFFKAGVAVVLTAGAVWGAWLLLKIGFSHRFTTVSIHEINAHGHAQIFGWVGLFVMGFAYQAFPRVKHTTLWRPDLANLTFYMMVIGIFVRAIGEPLFFLAAFKGAAMAATLMEISAIALFVVIIFQTFRRSGKPYERHDAYIIASLGFFLLQAIYDFGMLYATTSAGSREELLRVISTYQAPLRDLQIHGFAMLMILGVGIRMFSPLFGFARPGPKLVRRCLVLILLGIAGESIGFVLMRGTSNHAWAGLMYGGMLLLAGGSVALTFRWGLLARPEPHERSSKFIRMGVAWLHTSMLMLLLLPVYQRLILPAAGSLSASGQESLTMGFSHAYYGAVRHAITVGFISLTILGMAAKIVPTLSGVDVRRLRALWLPFALVNLGCFLRVAFQIGTDFREWAYPVAGISGLLEVTGIAIWGVHLWRLMCGSLTVEQILEHRPSRITAEHRIGLIVEWFPTTLPVLIARGFTPLANPVLRRTLARGITLRTAAAQHGLDLRLLVDELNSARSDQAIGRNPGQAAPLGISLPVLNNP